MKKAIELEDLRNWSADLVAHLPHRLAGLFEAHHRPLFQSPEPVFDSCKKSITFREFFGIEPYTNLLTLFAAQFRQLFKDFVDALCAL